MSRVKGDVRWRKFAELRAKGIDRQQSAVMAGYSDAENMGRQVEQGQDVQQELARLRAETAKNIKVTKEDVAAGFKAAADMAQTMADPTGMVAAWRELGKLLGYYAPEVKKLEKRINKHDLLAAMDQLSDEELLQLRGGRVIEVKPDSVDTKSLPLLPSE